MIKNALKRVPGARPLVRGFRRGFQVIKRRIFGPGPIERYFLEQREVLRRVLQPDSSAIDVGANRGDILVDIVHNAPLGQHWAFEPVPSVAAQLKVRFPNVCVLPYALAEVSSRTVFYVTKHNTAYSSLEDQDPGFLDKIGLPDASKEMIDVEIRRMDEVIPESARIALIKITVQGAELRTIAGALGTISRCKPIVLILAGFYSEARAREFFEIFRPCGLHVSLMARWLRNEPPPQTFAEFLPIAKKNFYFIAHP